MCIQSDCSKHLSQLSCKCPRLAKLGFIKRTVCIVKVEAPEEISTTFDIVKNWLALMRVDQHHDVSNIVDPRTQSGSLSNLDLIPIRTPFPAKTPLKLIAGS